MPKTTTRTPGRLSGKFWKLLGAATEKNQGRSLAQVKASADYATKAADLGDEDHEAGVALVVLPPCLPALP